MQKKDTAKKARKGSAPTKAEQRAQLARTLYAASRAPFSLDSQIIVSANKSSFSPY